MLRSVTIVETLNPLSFYRYTGDGFQCCPKEFMRFLCKFLIKLITGNLQSIKRHHVASFQNKIRIMSLHLTSWRQKKDVLGSEENLELIKVITPLVDSVDIEQPVLDSASVFYKGLINQSVTKQELSKY